MLYVYRSISPNKDLQHYYFENAEDYLTFLASRIVKQFELNNYRINTNIIKVKIDSDLTLETTNRLTYAIDVRRDSNNNINYFRAYFINDVSIQSGYAILDCEVDLWGSYIYEASIYDIYIERSNKLLTNYPIYDDIKAVEEKEYIASVDSDGEVNGLATPDYMSFYQEIRRYYLVMVVNYNAKQNLTGNDYIATTCCMAIRLDALNTAYGGSTSTIVASNSAVRLAQDFAGGVFGITANLGHNDANVINAYIVRDFAVNKTGNFTSLKSVSLLMGGTELTIQADILGASDYADKLFIRNITPNRQYYFGKVHGGLKLNRIYHGSYTNVYIRFIISASNVEVIAIQGENQEDITSAFMLTITNNVSQTTPLRRIAEAISKTASIAPNVMKGNAIATAGSLASMVGDFSIDSKIRGDGDALHTFGSVAGNYVEIPFKATYFISVIDEEHIIKDYGATFNHRFLGGISGIFWASYILSGTSLTYVKARDAIILGVPKNACEYIANEFKRGIYLQDIRPSN